MTRAFIYPVIAVLSLVMISVSEAQITPSVDGIVYVDASASPSGSGASWGSAAQSLADAVLAAHENTDIVEIRVARGTYYPEHIAGNGDHDRDKAFVFARGNLRVLGGYPPGGAGERDPAANSTILSGDIDKDDEDDIPDDGNTYHVVITSSDAVNHTFVFDGFTVMGANSADQTTNTFIQVAGSSVSRSVGAWVSVNSGPTVRNSIIRNNSSRFGGGWGNISSNPSLENVVIRNNSAVGGGGGWYYVGGTVNLVDVTITGNTAGGDGGGWYSSQSNYPSSVTGSGAVISYNKATRYGGGWHNEFSSVPVTGITIDNNEAVSGGGWYNNGGLPKLTGVALTNNSATGNGGGWFNIQNTSPELTDVLISGNWAEGRGGGWYNQAGFPVLTNAIIENNTAVFDGGGWYHFSSTASVETKITNVVIRGNEARHGGGWFNSSSNPTTFVNVVVSGNTAEENGGGWYNAAGSPKLTNVTIAGNSASEEAGGWFHVSGSATLANCIIYGNQSAITGSTGIYFTDQDLTDISYSLVQGYNAGSNNLPGNTDPMFEQLVVAAYEEPTTAGNYNLKPGSPVVNKGNPATNPGLFPKDDEDDPTDLAGNLRIYGPQIDMGAYELIDESALPVVLVSFTGALNEGAVQLNWQTTEEMNFSHFEIQRSVNGKSFESIGNVTAVGGVGGQGIYSFRDGAKIAGAPGRISYYRLKMVDNDYSFAYSPIISVKRDDPDGLAVRLFPNPVRNGAVALEIEGRQGQLDVKVFDLLGRETGVPVLLSAGKAELETGRLPAGLYLVHINGAGTAKTIKLVVE